MTNSDEDIQFEPLEVNRILNSLAGQYLRSGLAREDLVQEGWVGVLKARRDRPFDEDYGTPWQMYVVVFGSWGMLNGIRAEAQQSSPPDPDGKPDPHRLWLKPRKKRAPLMEIEDEEDIEQLASELDMQVILDALTARERRAVELRFWHNLKQCDAAKVMEVSQATYNKTLSRAIEKLRAELSPKGQKRLDWIPTLKGPKA